MYMYIVYANSIWGELCDFVSISMALWYCNSSNLAESSRSKKPVEPEEEEEEEAKSLFKSE